jgi:serine/threonine protein kinase
MADLFRVLRGFAGSIYQNVAWFIQVIRAEYCPDRDEADADTQTTRPAPEVQTVSGPQRAYTLLGSLAVGDAADVYLGSAAESYYLLKMSRSGAGNIRLDNERQVLATLSARAGTTTYRHYLPALVDSFTVHEGFPKRINMFAYEPGFYTLEQVHEQHPALDGRHLAWIFNRLLTVLGFCHRRQIVHGAILPCHVLLHTANHGLQLVGWGQSVQAGETIAIQPSRYQDWYPVEILKHQPVSPATDVFLAAQCVTYLAGGDPVHDRMPDTVPAPMRAFIKSCLLEGAAMRPHDAWTVMEEFDDLLRRLYGPPQFHPLSMS